MRITDLIQESGIDLQAQPMAKRQAIQHLVARMGETGNINDLQKYEAAVFAREAEGTTGIGDGIAIPHAKSDAVKQAGICAMVCKNGIDFDALDGNPVHLFFLLAAPNTVENVHLQMLSHLSVLLMDREVCENLIHAASPKEFLEVMNQAEQKMGDEKEQERQEKQMQSTYRVLAVTACPTGIAHTYMAAEGLEKAAKEKGISIKVETDGSGGVKNRLTTQEIAACDGIIIAADKTVQTDRFNGKPVLITRVADGIHKPDLLIEQILSGDVPSHVVEGVSLTSSAKAKDGFGHQFYKHLMDGVSHMLPFVIGGGILMALAFLFDAGASGTANFGHSNPFSAFLYGVGNLSFGLMFPVLAAYIARSIGDRPALAIGFVGGLIASGAGTAFFGGSTSGFFGALFAGFISGYLMIGLKKLFAFMPKSLESIKPILIYPLLGLLGIGAIMVFLVNPPVSIFNEWLIQLLNSMGDSSLVILGVVLGAMMSIDFGGPINKAAYVFGTMSIATGQYQIMAAVMIGGMVPPLAIALCTTFFKSRFSKEERQAGLTCYIMGLCFVTEGAIPFAASDPLRVIPSCAIGAGVAGGLSMLFGCSLSAPHGGIFVTPIIGNWPMFLLALVIGSVVGMLFLALLKKPRVKSVQ